MPAFISGLLVGLFLGANIGLLVLAILSAAGDDGGELPL